MTFVSKFMSLYVYNSDYNVIYLYSSVSNMHLWYSEDITPLRYWSNGEVPVYAIKAYGIVEE
jgi:hypothetical protein